MIWFQGKIRAVIFLRGIISGPLKRKQKMLTWMKVYV